MSHDTHYIGINIASDYYSATLTVEIAEGAPAITTDEIKKAIANKNITFGIETHLIDTIAKNQESVYDVEIAKGIEHINGQNGKITYKFDKSLKSKPTVNDDGSVDFKDIHILNIAQKGQVLATRTMPTEGKSGTTVTGKIVPARKGKVANFKFGKNVLLSEDELSILSEVEGNIEVSGEKISVISVLEINSNVGIATGNIDFVGDVIIKGDVTTGYSVNAEGNVVVNGIVEAATIKCKGDLTIGYGVQGADSANLEVGGDLTAKFINNTNVVCKKNILAGAIMHSSVICDDSIILAGKISTIVGGDVYARNEIQVSTLGSEMGTKTKLSLGVNDEILEAYHEVQRELDDIKSSVVKINQVIKALEKKYHTTQSVTDKLILERTRHSKTEYASQIEKIKSKLRAQQHILDSTANAKILATTLYPGVKVIISGAPFNTKTPIKGVKLMKKGHDVEMLAI